MTFDQKLDTLKVRPVMSKNLLIQVLLNSRENNDYSLDVDMALMGSSIIDVNMIKRLKDAPNVYNVEFSIKSDAHLDADVMPFIERFIADQRFGNAFKVLALKGEHGWIENSPKSVSFYSQNITSINDLFQLVDDEQFTACKSEDTFNSSNGGESSQDFVFDSHAAYFGTFDMSNFMGAYSAEIAKRDSYLKGTISHAFPSSESLAHGWSGKWFSLNSPPNTGEYKGHQVRCYTIKSLSGASAEKKDPEQVAKSITGLLSQIGFHSVLKHSRRGDPSVTVDLDRSAPNYSRS